ncbi:MAG: glutathione peroxidase [Bryobacteraceae bacterium]
MTRLTLFALPILMASTTFGASSIYEFQMNSIDGKPISLSDYQGKVVLIVNVASRCGFTPQYSALENVYRQSKDRGFVILGFPANNFKDQEPGTNEEIKQFCQRKYDVTFPMFAKISVKGTDEAPLYQFLTDKNANPETGGEIPWNFTKFLIGRDGKVLARFAPKTTPDSPEVTEAIQKALEAPGT